MELISTPHVVFGLWITCGNDVDTNYVKNTLEYGLEKVAFFTFVTEKTRTQCKPLI